MRLARPKRVIALALAILVLVPTIALANVHWQYNGYAWDGVTYGGTMWAHGHCNDGIADRVVVNLWESVSNGQGTGMQRRFCLNEDSVLWGFWDRFCDQVPGNAGDPPGFCGTYLDDSFNDTASMVKVTVLNGDSAVAVCKDNGLVGGCWNIFNVTTLDFSQGGTWNDKISSLKIVKHQDDL